MSASNKILCFILGLMVSTALFAKGPLFRAPISIAMPNASYGIYGTDLFLDKRAEFIVFYCDDAGGQTGVTIYSHFHARAFRKVQNYRVSCPRSLVAADFNGDKIKDIVGVSADGQGPLGMFVLYGNKAGTFTGPTRIQENIDWTGDLLWSDFDNDRVLDLVASYYTNDGHVGTKVISGANLFGAAIDIGNDLGHLRTSHFNDDAYGDILRVKARTFQILEGDGHFNFAFGEQAPVPAHKYGKSFKADFDENGKIDTIIAYNDADSTYGATVLFPPTLQNMQSFPLPGPMLTVGDFNRDSHVDILTYSPTKNFLLVPGQGDGSFAMAEDTGMEAEHVPDFPLPSKSVVADFNGDGRLDLITITSAFSPANLWLGRR